MAKKKASGAANKQSPSNSTPVVVAAEPAGIDNTSIASKSNNKEPQDTVDGVTDHDNTTGDDDDVEEEELELLQVDLGDMIKIKQVLDETVAGSLLDPDHINHVPEDYKWDNIKLLIMTLACTFAMVAQFAPIPFPESRPVLGICGTLYFIFSTILQVITTFIDQDSIIWALPISTSPNQDLQKHGFIVRTNLERYTEWYTVIIEFHKEQAKKDQKPNFVQQRYSIAQFFDKEGYFDETGVMDEIDKLYKRFVNGQYDKEPLSSSGAETSKTKKD